MLLTDMYDALESAGLSVYLAGQHDGPCEAPYVIVSDAGTTATGKTCGFRSFIVTACVPIGAPLKLRETMAAAAEALETIGSIRRADTSEEDIDEETLCRFMSTEYRALCSLI